MVWTSPVLVILKDANSEENPLQRSITLYEEGIIASIHAAGIAFGPLILSKGADFIGRKWFLISIGLAEFFSFVILAIGIHIYMYYFARIIQGICIGCSITVLPLFIAEISESFNRGKLVTINSIFVSLGNVYAYTMSSIFRLKCYTLMCSVPALISAFLLIITIPESPIYLIMKNKRKQGKQALMKFRNIDFEEAENVVSEITEMISSIPVGENIFVFLKNRGFRRSLIISNGLFVFMQFSGIVAILEYLHMIFFIAEIPFSKNISSIVVGLTQSFSVLIATSLIEKLGRKRLQLLAATVVVISLFLVGIYFQLKTFRYNIQCISWLPVICVIIFIVGYGTGLGPVSYVLLSEIFPPKFKLTAASISMLTAAVAAFFVLFGFPLVRDFMGIQWCFWFFSTATLLNIIFIHFYVIETKNKSFLEIQTLLEKKIDYRKPSY